MMDFLEILLFIIMHLIRKALDTAYKMDIIPNNPADKVQRPKKEQYIGSFYTRK